jgi:hypothetical protein
MRLFALFALCLLLGACCGTVKTPPAAASPVTPNVLKSMTVALVAKRGEEIRPYCSGVWVKPNTILTAAHCVDEDDLGEQLAYLVEGDLESKQTRAGRLLARDEDHDLALVQALGQLPGHASAQFHAGPIDAGVRVYTMGHSLGLWLFVLERRRCSGSA